MSAQTSPDETMPPDPPYGFYIVLAGLSALVRQPQSVILVGVS